MNMESGIYEIVNKTNGKRYIGQAINITNRFKVHKCLLNQNKHRNNHLQHAWNKYGEDNFMFKVLGYYKPCLLTLMEQSFMGLYIFETELYNLAPAAGSSLGVKHSDETKRKISEVQRGRKLSQEHKRNISLNSAQRGKPLNYNHKIALLEKGKNTRFIKGKTAGENHPMVKLNWEKVKEIREKSKNGINGVTLAKEYNVTPTQISNIINNKLWIEENK